GARDRHREHHGAQRVSPGRHPPLFLLPGLPLGFLIQIPRNRFASRRSDGIMRRLFLGGAILIRRSTMRWIAIEVVEAAIFSAVAGTIDVNLSNDTIEGKFTNPIGAADLTFGGLYNRDDSNWFLNIGLLAAGDGSAGSSRFSGGLGGKIYTVHAG